MKPISDARTCKDGCTYLQGRMHVLAGKVASTSVENAVHCKDGCSTLQGRMQCTAEADAVHCGSGCSALRLRWAKLAQKSSVLFYRREKGGETCPIWVTVATLIYLVSIERALVAMMRFPISSLAVSNM